MMVQSPEPIRRNRILVLGMHRSGTSATMAALKALGAHVGADDELTGQNWENPNGFFERKDMRAMCDSLLHAAGADWWKVANFSVPQIPAHVLAEQQAAQTALMGALDAQGIWALKEPRLCLLLPVFPELHASAVVVFINRHPLEVALSLRRRNGFSLLAGLALWEVYTHHALWNLKAVPHVMLDYTALTENPAGTLQSLAHELQGLGVDVTYQPDAAGAIASELRREQADEDLFARLATPSQIRLWEALRGLRGTATLLEQGLPDSTLETLRQFEEDETRSATVRSELAETKETLRKTEKQLAELQARTETQLRDLNAAVARRDAALSAMQASTSWKLTAPLRLLGRIGKPKA